MVARTRPLRAEGYRTGMITNNVVEFRELLAPDAPPRRAVRRGHRLVRGGHAQARPAHLLAHVDRLGVGPSRAAFLDDYPGNIGAAARPGWHAILVTADYELAIAELDDRVADVG